VKFSSIYHSQSNGATKRANGLFFLGIKKCLYDQKKGKWIDELPKVIWSHNTTVLRAIGFTPFLLLLALKQLKDRYGEPEGGSEWEPIKILLEGDGGSNKMNTASNTRL
jgi:hypothetical protein